MPMASPLGLSLLLPLLPLLSSLPLLSQARTHSGQGLQALFLRPHNAARAAVGLPALVWDDNVAGYARWYAEQRRGDCRLVHSYGPYGENLFWGSGVGWSPAQAVGEWVAERQWYDYLANACRGGMCGHYTQIVWRSTARLGCAMVTCYGGRGTFVVCSYDPPGNYVGMRPY